MQIQVRKERPDDIPAIHTLNKIAFDQEQEAKIVDALRKNGAAMLSLVAICNGQVVGHIMYSPVTIGDKLEGAALGSMSVSPQYQGKGIGSQLVRAGNEQLKSEGCPFIIVLGHTGYYPRFGFKSASKFGVSCEWDVPDNVFMLLVLDEGQIHGVTGQARYRHEFSDAM